MIKVLNDVLSPEEYNSVALHPLQSWEWGDARKAMGVETFRLGQFDKNKLRNVFQLTLHKLPATSYRIGYLPRSVNPSKEVLDFLKDLAEKEKLIFIKSEPYVKKTGKAVLDGRLNRSSHSLFPDWTQILDLRKSEEELLAGMKSKTRYNTRLAQKKGVRIREMTNEQGFEIFIKLYFETTKRQKYFGHKYEYHRAVFDHLKNKIARLLIAFYENTPVSAYQLFIFKKGGYYTYGGSTNEHRNTMAANLLMWESIKFAKNKGCEYFDMWGSLEPDYDPEHPWSGFTRFKEGYGGDFVEFIGSYDLVTHPLLYSGYNVLHQIREVYLKLKAGL